MGDAENDVYVRMKRRRSSLFCDIINEPSLSFEATEPNANKENNDGTQSELESYIKQLKNCKRSWIHYEKELKTKLKNSGGSLRLKKIEAAQQHFENYLDPEDKEFLGRATEYVTSLASTEQKIFAIASKAEIIKACIERNRESCEELVRNLQFACKTSMMQAIKNLEVVPAVIGDEDIPYPISDDASPIL